MGSAWQAAAVGPRVARERTTRAQGLARLGKKIPLDDVNPRARPRRQAALANLNAGKTRAYKFIRPTIQ